MKTMRTVRRERSRVVLILFIVATSNDFDRFPHGNQVSPEVIKKTFTLGMVAWIKVLLTG